MYLYLTMKKFYLFLFLLTTQYSLLSTVMAQPTIQWMKSYGENKDDVLYSAVVAKDGNIVFAGYSNSDTNAFASNHGAEDFWVVKMDTAGNVIYQKLYGGTNWEIAGTMCATKDGGIITTGLSYSSDGEAKNSHGMADFLVVKVDGDGTLQWSKCYGGSKGERAYSIIELTTGGYLISGLAQSNDGDVLYNRGQDDFWILKLDSAGDTLWSKIFGGSGIDVAHNVIETKDGGYLISGYGDSYDGDFIGNNSDIGGEDGLLIKLDKDGNTQWKKLYGGNFHDDFYSIKQLNDGGFIIAGTSNSTDADFTNNHGYSDMWVLRLKENGDTMWTRCFGGSEPDGGYQVKIDTDDNFVIMGGSSSSDGDVMGTGQGSTDMWFIKVDTLGKLLWHKCIGGYGGQQGADILVFPNANYMAIGYSAMNDEVVKDNHGGFDASLVKLQGGAVGISEHSSPLENIKLWPNPVSESILHIDYNKSIDVIEVYDILGQRVLQAKNVKHLDVSGLTKGIYSVNISSNEFSVVRKIVIQ